jgi:hypothetical protein
MGWCTGSAPDSGGALFESQPGHWLFWLKFLWFSSVPPGKCWDSTLIMPQPLFSKLFPLHLSSYCLMLRVLQNKPQENNTISFILFLALQYVRSPSGNSVTVLHCYSTVYLCMVINHNSPIFDSTYRHHAFSLTSTSGERGWSASYTGYFYLHRECNFYAAVTKQVGIGSDASDFYLGGAWSESRPGHQLSWLRCIVIFTSPFKWIQYFLFILPLNAV